MSPPICGIEFNRSSYVSSKAKVKSNEIASFSWLIYRTTFSQALSIRVSESHSDYEMPSRVHGVPIGNQDCARWLVDKEQ